ncbi:MAG TPA: DUF4242 domain-containing protein [Longimicrobiales bacterium]|nr:DUF4242 domain-containing protein [Longimicrobiales bacterium]
MPKYIIERELPGAGELSKDQLAEIAKRSCSVLRDMGPAIQWIQSYVTDDVIYCVYVAPDERAILEHARRGGFPADSIATVRQLIDPVTAEPVTVAA